MSGNDLYFFLAGLPFGWLMGSAVRALINRWRRRSAQVPFP